MYFANTNFQSLQHARYLETTTTDADKRRKLNELKANVQINHGDMIRKSNNNARCYTIWYIPRSQIKNASRQ
jgi:hypothetical protein